MRVACPVYLPEAADSPDRQPVLDGDSKRPEAFRSITVESDSRFGVGVLAAAFAGLVCLDAMAVKNRDERSDSGVQI